MEGTIGFRRSQCQWMGRRGMDGREKGRAESAGRAGREQRRLVGWLGLDMVVVVVGVVVVVVVLCVLRHAGMQVCRHAGELREEDRRCVGLGTYLPLDGDEPLASLESLVEGIRDDRAGPHQTLDWRPVSGGGGMGDEAQQAEQSRAGERKGSFEDGCPRGWEMGRFWRWRHDRHGTVCT